MWIGMVLGVVLSLPVLGISHFCRRKWLKDMERHAPENHPDAKKH